MRILFVGDIVGKPGKRACSQIIPRLVRQREIDCVIANAENTAAGSGITPQMFQKLLRQGIDCCTMGDHIYRRREIVPTLEESERIVKPANLPPEAAGREYILFETRDGARVGVFSLLGRTYMNVRADCPFHAADRVVAELERQAQIIVVDVHAETTSEKVALGWHLDGRVTAVVGTHTHIPTADERILPGGTAYISDVGMTGPYDSVLGRRKDRVLRSLITGMPFPYDVATDDVRLCGVLIEADMRNGLALSIERICELDTEPAENGDEDDDNGRSGGE